MPYMPCSMLTQRVACTRTLPCPVGLRRRMHTDRDHVPNRVMLRTVRMNNTIRALPIGDLSFERDLDGTQENKAAWARN